MVDSLPINKITEAIAKKCDEQKQMSFNKKNWHICFCIESSKKQSLFTGINDKDVEIIENSYILQLQLFFVVIFPTVLFNTL